MYRIYEPNHNIYQHTHNKSEWFIKLQLPAHTILVIYSTVFLYKTQVRVSSNIASHMTSLERNAKVYNTPFNTTNTLLAPTTYMLNEAEWISRLQLPTHTITFNLDEHNTILLEYTNYISTNAIHAQQVSFSNTATVKMYDYL